MDYVAVLISIYVGTNNTVSIQKESANKHINNKRLAITNIDSLIPLFEMRDRVTFQHPDFSQLNEMAQQVEDDGKEEQDPDAEPDEDPVESELDIEVSSMTASYAFAALPDQRLISDGKCQPYVLDDNFRWTILHGTGITPPRLEHRVAAYVKIRGAGL